MVQELTFNRGGTVDTLPEDIVQELINFSENELNVPPSYLITKLHYEGLWGNSATARANNNWSGMTWGVNWNDPHKRESGVTVTRGTARPANEGGHYIKYDSFDDFMTDWTDLIKRDGIYNVADSDTFDEAVAGMFRYGGASADYATMNVTGSERRYRMYLEGMKARRTAINNQNNGALDRYDNENYADTDESTGSGTTNNPPTESENTGFDLNGIIDMIENGIKEALEKDIFHSGESQVWFNQYLRIQKQLNNTYKVNMNIDFKEIISNITDEIINNLDQLSQGNHDQEKEDAKNDPDNQSNEGGDDESNESEHDKVFPVRIQNGINFFNWRQQRKFSLPYNMGYVTRPNGNGHYGIDIGGGGNGIRHPIYSITDGTVVRTQTRNGIGNVVCIKQKGVNRWFEYGHLSSWDVKQGQEVKAGQKIANMGDTGLPNIAIHLDLKINETGQEARFFYTWADTIDPTDYLEITGNNKTNLPEP